MTETLLEPGRRDDDRSRAVEDVAPVAVAFALHDWREAVRGDAAGELVLLWLLQAAAIGHGDDLDARLVEVAQRPSAVPDVGDRADLLRSAVLSGAAIDRGGAVLQDGGRDGVGPGETLLVLLRDAVRIASGERDPSALAAAVEHLDVASERAGRLVSVRMPVHRSRAESLRASLQAGDTAEFAGAFAEEQRAVLGFLLQEVRPARPPANWETWLTGRDRRFSWTAVRSLGGRALAALIGVALSMAIGAVLVLLPHQLPGRLPDSRLTTGAAGPCAACRPADRVTGVGMHSADGRRYVTVRLASDPDHTELRLSFLHRATRVRAVQSGSSDGWKVAVSPRHALGTKDLQVRSRGHDVVVTLPGSFEPGGVAVESSRGGRLPAVGFAPVATRPRAQVNLVDLVLVAMLALAAWRGWRRGFVAFLPRLTGFVVTLFVSRLLYPPLGAALVDVIHTTSRVANALAFTVLTTVIGFALYFAAGKFTSGMLGRFGDRLPLRQGSREDRGVGAAAGIVRTSAILASLLVVVVDLVAASRVSGAVSASVLGRAVVSGWRGLYGGL